MKKMVQLKSINELQAGDIVRGKISHQTFTVVANFGTRATAVKVADITNPAEWEVYREDGKESPRPFDLEEPINIKKKVKDFWVCARCNITSKTKGRMIPCPRGGCEAEIKGTITTTTIKTEIL